MGAKYRCDTSNAPQLVEIGSHRRLNASHLRKFDSLLYFSVDFLGTVFDEVTEDTFSKCPYYHCPTLRTRAKRI